MKTHSLSFQSSIYFFAGIFFLFSCTSSSKKENNPLLALPKVFEIKGYVLPNDSIKAPLIGVVESEIAPISKTDSIKIDKNWDKNDGKLFSYFKNKIGQEDDQTKYIGGAAQLYNPRSIVQDKKGNLWFASIGGLSCYDGNAISYFTDANFTEEQGFSYNVVNDILEDDKGDIWFSTGNGRINKYDGKNFIGFKTDGQAILSSLEDKNGNLWFCGFDGVRCYNGKIFTQFRTEQGLSKKDVYCILEDKNGAMWFGTWEGGLNKYAGKTFTRFSEKEGLCNNKIMSLLEDKSGNLWAGTSGGGAICYNKKIVTTFTKIQGLANDTVNSICQDEKGNIWFGTNNGLSEMRAENLRLLEQNKYLDSLKEPWFRNFNAKDGFKGGSFLPNSVCKDKNENIWWGTSNGLLIYHPDRDKTIVSPVVQQSNWWEKWWFWTSIGILIVGSVNGYFRYKVKTRKLN